MDLSRRSSASCGYDETPTAHGMPPLLRQVLAWSGALVVTVITIVLVLLDIADGPVHRYFSRHSFTSSVLSGLLVLLLTVLIIDRVARRRQLRDRSRAIGAQAAIIVAQADRAVDAIKTAAASGEGREAAAGELRTYTQMLLTSAPVLIDASRSRAFLQAAQRVAAEVFWALGDGDDEDFTKTRLDAAVNDLRMAANPVLGALTRRERAAVGPGG